MIFILFLCAYSITFGMQHKVPFLHGKLALLDSMLKCTYCTGFHGGWIAYSLYTGISYLEQNPANQFRFAELLIFALASAVFSYLLDTLARVLEKYAE